MQSWLHISTVSWERQRLQLIPSICILPAGCPSQFSVFYELPLLHVCRLSRSHRQRCAIHAEWWKYFWPQANQHQSAWLHWSIGNCCGSLRRKSHMRMSHIPHLKQSIAQTPQSGRRWFIAVVIHVTSGVVRCKKQTILFRVLEIWFCSKNVVTIKKMEYNTYFGLSIVTTNEFGIRFDVRRTISQTD